MHSICCSGYLKECLFRGCLPKKCLSRGSAQGVSTRGRCLTKGGVCPGGVSFQGCLSRGCLPHICRTRDRHHWTRGRHPPHQRQTPPAQVHAGIHPARQNSWHMLVKILPTVADGWCLCKLVLSNKFLLQDNWILDKIWWRKRTYFTKGNNVLFGYWVHSLQNLKNLHLFPLVLTFVQQIMTNEKLCWLPGVLALGVQTTLNRYSHRCSNGHTIL